MHRFAVAALILLGCRHRPAPPVTITLAELPVASAAVPSVPPLPRCAPHVESTYDGAGCWAAQPWIGFAEPEPLPPAATREETIRRDLLGLGGEPGRVTLTPIGPGTYAVSTSVTSSGAATCHSFSAHLDAQGTARFGGDGTLLEAHLRGRARLSHGMCMGCGKDGQDPCPVVPCDQGTVAIAYRNDCL